MNTLPKITLPMTSAKPSAAIAQPSNLIPITGGRLPKKKLAEYPF
jgi:hypothetical protein